MYRTKAYSIIGFGLSIGCSIVTPAEAQTQMQFMTQQQFNKMAKQQAESAHHNFGPPPPQSSVVRPKIYPMHGLWICKSTIAFKPIHRSPNQQSSKIGETLKWIGTTGPYVQGYAKVISFGGKIGYVNKKYIKPFHDKFAPHASCVLEGTQANGMPMYDIR